MTVQEKLKKLREDKHFSDKDVAEILGMRLDSYARLEHGVGKIGSFLKKKLALLYDKDPDYFVDDAEVQTGPEPESDAEPEIMPQDIPGQENTPEPETAEGIMEEQSISPEPESADILPVELPESDEEEEADRVSGKEANDRIAAKLTVERFSVSPDKSIKTGEKEKIRVGKKVASVEVSDKSIAKVKKKGKKIRVKGKSPGMITVSAFDKEGQVLGSWMIRVE